MSVTIIKSSINRFLEILNLILFICLIIVMLLHMFDHIPLYPFILFELLIVIYLYHYGSANYNENINRYQDSSLAWSNIV